MSRLERIRELVEKLEFKVTALRATVDYGLTINLKGPTRNEVIYVPFSDSEWIEIFSFCAEEIGVPRD